MAKKQGVKHSAPAAELVPAAPQILPGVSQDEQYVTDVGRNVLQFLRGVAGFFTTANAIEREAVATLERARQLPAPATETDDLGVQEFVRQVNAQLKVAESHWSVTTLVHGFHRRLTAARARATGPLEDAQRIGNNLHFRYAEAERKRAAEEQERIRRQKELEEQQRRDREREAAEAAAVKLEEQAEELSPREQVFVQALAAGTFPASDSILFKAASRAGYPQPRSAAERLMKQAKILKAIEALRQAAAVRQQAAVAHQAPLETVTETVRPNVSKAAGTSERVTHGAEVLDAQALIDAVLSGKRPDIPRDVLMVDESKVNAYGKQLQAIVNGWPGVRYTKKEKMI